MSDWKSIDNVRVFEEQIQRALRGDERSIAFLRMRVADAAATAPAECIIQLAGFMVDYRKSELGDEAEAN